MLKGAIYPLFSLPLSLHNALYVTPPPTPPLQQVSRPQAARVAWGCCRGSADLQGTKYESVWIWRRQMDMKCLSSKDCLERNLMALASFRVNFALEIGST